MLSMFATNDNITVELATFKAGGDAMSKDAQPILKICLKQARIRTYTLLGGGAVGGAVEIVEFTFRELEITSSPQQASGKRGAVRDAPVTFWPAVRDDAMPASSAVVQSRL